MPRTPRTPRPAAGAELAAVADLLWQLEADTAAEPRPRLSAPLIVRTAVALADTEGLEAVSMQRVAAELGCTAMALYRHVPGKDQLVAAMSDVAAGHPPAAGGVDWRAEVEAWVEALWGRYLRHPWMLRTPTRSAPVGPGELAWFEAVLTLLQRAGVERGQLIPLATFVSSAVRDLARVATELDPAGAAAYGQVLAERLDPTRFPTLCALAGEEGLDEDEDGDVTPIVRHGLRYLLDGIEARVASGRTRAPSESPARSPQATSSKGRTTS
ncbi:TetR/AcrR family transcriptional regulator [Streptomyces sp. NPDC087440]|uniref:TetR/AcrR family transcriptional regulator n=1 Tax=Streptomyces sp. NPDC087440 TaxID=3365790 RepID=UPI0037FACDC7